MNFISLNEKFGVGDISLGKNRDYLKNYPDFEPYKYNKETFLSIKEEEIWKIDEKMAKLPED